MMDVRQSVEQQIGSLVLQLLEAQAEIARLNAKVKEQETVSPIPGYEADQEGIASKPKRPQATANGAT
jgi:hypothetical protein